MDSAFSIVMPSKIRSSAAFILYKPQDKKSKGYLFFNDAAGQVLSLSLEPSRNPDFSQEILALCSRWKELLDKRVDELKATGDEGDEADFIDTLKSHRRRYSVKGAVLTGNVLSAQGRVKQYLFILERFRPDNINFSKAVRSLNLNKREQDIMKLLLEDRSNKEISDILGLSPNTIKSYMKMFMRKLGVSSRAGIVSVFLSAK